MNSYRKRLNRWLDESYPIIPASEENIALAKSFVLKRWQERTQQRNILFKQDKPLPTHLGNACKFCSLFAVKLFGGAMRGNHDHQWIVVDGRIVDLTDNVDGGDYKHDSSFWFNTEHVRSLLDCTDRVDDWLMAFNQEHH